VVLMLTYLSRMLMLRMPTALLDGYAGTTAQFCVGPPQNVGLRPGLPISATRFYKML